ncbi:hypothetical protein CB0940_11228 [Cercospora beticola]|uniref:Uncharacterized protein n=2 Tax=Cercospora beticola TaxID=122368 RepID=A0A2G5HE30_CERBT|nr:hypothetical protein CB0940_11228 [Cercospora beticola]PIA90816.1 hypothetical protein CB0940_11228 [Cercospora beticola]
MSPGMNHSVLRTSEPAKLARYFQEQGAQHGIQAVTKELLEGIENESLPPTIYGIWLNASGDCQAVHAGLIQHFSRSVRHASSVKFGRILRSDRAKEIWQAVGGTLGIVAFLSQAAVRDVKQFCHEVGRAWSSRVAVEVRQQLVDELYLALVQQNFSPSVIKVLERRPLRAHYRRVAPAGSTALATVHVRGNDQALKTSSLEAHSNFFREQFLQSLADETQKVDFNRMAALLNINCNDQTAYHGHRLPVNVVFAIHALEGLSQRVYVEDFKSGKLHALLREKLFAKLYILKIKPKLVAEVVDSYARYFDKHVRRKYNFSFYQKKTILEFIARKWCRHPQELTPSLIRVFRLIPKTQTIHLMDFEKLLIEVPWSARLRLFELAVQHIPSLGHDISTDHGLKALSFEWTERFLLCLDKPGARRLFDRLVRLKPDLFGTEEIQEVYQIKRDPTYLRLLLAVEDPDLLQLANAALDYRKKEAYKARKQPERCFWIQYALRCATASCSLPLYRDTLVWARKYTRDPLTAAVIYSQSDLQRSDSIALLRGFGAVASGGSAADVQRDVQQANVICRELLDTACEAVGEPSFSRHHWTGVFSLMDAVVHSRFKHVNALQDKLHIPNEALYEIVWQDTLETCIILETLGLQDSNADLEFNKVGGPLCNTADWGSLIVVDDPRPATMRFLDQLAVRRNQLWESYRQAERPAVLTLPEVHPRGLPFQHLLPVSLVNCREAAHIPYLQERASQAVYADPEFAMSAPPEDEETIAAMGPFVENYGFALGNYVCWSSDRRATALNAWEHATVSLSVSRMSPEEAVSFWSPIFETALSNLDLKGPWNETPVPSGNLELPASNDGDGQPMEWNPDTEYRDFDVKFRRLPRTMLDVMVNNPFSRHGLHEDIKSRLEDECEGHVPARRTTLFWDRHQDRRASPATKEALIAAVLLYISAKNQMTPTLLAAPYPSGFDPRYPALYLDGDFLMREELDTDSIWDLLKMLAARIPPTLLLRLTEGVLNAADQTQKRTAQDALQLLQLLVKCDKPQVTLQLVQQIILDRPEDSSWHRMILHPGLLNSLPEAVARGFLTSLSEDIQLKLAGKVDRDSTSADEQQPAVKVTTVKLLAQLMSGAEFIEETQACQILFSILAVAKHVDIIVSVVHSLVGILKSPSGQDGKVNLILDALERFVVPIISSINERIPLREQQWQQLERDPSMELPEIYMESVATEIPPVLSTVLGAMQDLHENLQEQMLTRVLIPTLRGSVVNNTRWLKLLCRHLNMPDVELPSMPLKLRFLTQLLSYPSFIPASILDFWLQVYRSTYDPSTDIAFITKRIEEDSELRTSNAGKHWLSLFSGQAVPNLTVDDPFRKLLHTDDWKQKPGGPSISQIQNIVLQHAELLLHKAGPDFKDWEAFIKYYKSPSWVVRIEPAWTLYYQNQRPLVEEIYNRIEAMRTDEWQRNLDRSPVVLPDTFNLRMWLLIKDSENNPEEQFIRGVETLVEEIGSSQRPGAQHYKDLVVFVGGQSLPWEAQAKLALNLGDLKACERGGEGLFDRTSYARVDFAKRMVESLAKPQGVGLRNRVVDMVESWVGCFDEEIRMMGLRLRNVTDADRYWKNEKWYLVRVEE